MDSGAELFVTDRLRGRRLSPADAQAMLAVYGDADAMRFVADGSAADRDEIDAWIEVTLDNYTRRGYGMIALELRSEARVAGFAGLVHPDRQLLPELKYAFRRDFWGAGFATEAARAMLAWGASLGLDEVIATIHPDHHASRRVLEKAGMALAGMRTDGQGRPELCYAWRVDGRSPGAGAGARMGLCPAIPVTDSDRRRP